MKTKTLALGLLSSLIVVLAACSQEAPKAAPAAKKDEAPARPMPPAAPTAAPAEGEKKPPESSPENKAKK